MMNRRDLVCVFQAIHRWETRKSVCAAMICDINDSLIGPEQDPETIERRKVLWDTWIDVTKGERV